MSLSLLCVMCLMSLSHVSGYKTARDSGYGAPSSGYEEPVSEYGGYEATAPGSPDITPVLIGILVITGLALLFPSYVTLTDIRRKRSVIEDDVPGKCPVSDSLDISARNDLQARSGSYRCRRLRRGY